MTDILKDTNNEFYDDFDGFLYMITWESNFYYFLEESEYVLFGKS